MSRSYTVAMLELAILGLLKERPMHGYDLRKRLRGDFGLLSSLSFGSLYPALARLEAAGAVHEVHRRPWSPEAPGARLFTSAGSIAGERAAFRARLASRRAATARSGTGTRGRRVYELTTRGNEMFHHLLETEEPKPEGGRGFALRWAFARYLTPDARLLLLQRRRAQLLDAREGSRRGRIALAAPRPLPAFFVDHANEATEHDLNWIERLIEVEQAAHRSLHPRPICRRNRSIRCSPPELGSAVGSHTRSTFKSTATERSEP